MAIQSTDLIYTERMGIGGRETIENLKSFINPSIVNIEEFIDDSFIYFVFNTPNGGFQVNRFQNSVNKTVAVGTNRPTTLAEVQSLNFL